MSNICCTFRYLFSTVVPLKFWQIHPFNHSSPNPLDPIRTMTTISSSHRPPKFLHRTLRECLLGVSTRCRGGAYVRGLLNNTSPDQRSPVQKQQPSPGQQQLTNLINLHKFVFFAGAVAGSNAGWLAALYIHCNSSHFRELFRVWRRGDVVDGAGFFLVVGFIKVEIEKCWKWRKKIFLHLLKCYVPFVYYSEQVCACVTFGGAWKDIQMEPGGSNGPEWGQLGLSGGWI